MKVSFTMLIILMMIDCEVKRKEFPWEIKVGKGKKKKKKRVVIRLRFAPCDLRMVSLLDSTF